MPLTCCSAGTIETADFAAFNPATLARLRFSHRFPLPYGLIPDFPNLLKWLRVLSTFLPIIWGAALAHGVHLDS